MWALLSGGLLAGCSQGVVIVVVEPDTGTVLDSASPTDTGDDTGSSTSDTVDSADVESVPGVDDPADDVFAIDQVHTIDITLGPGGIQALTNDAYTHVETDVLFDGQLLTSVGVRLKGRYGSFRTLSQKSGFKIDLNRFNEGQTLFGLTHLNVNNMVQDNAQLHDHVAYGAYRVAGVPAPRVGYAWVTVDGTDYGLYALVEDYDEHFLAEHYEQTDGNLYDGDYWLADDWSYYVLVDFEESAQEYFELDAGTDVDLADVRAVTDAVAESCRGQGFDETLEAVVDMDQWLRFFAMEMWAGQWDGYNYNSNNYRVYFDPERDGRMVMMPWDHDQPFYSDLWIDDPVGLLGRCCLADFGCEDRLYDILDEICLDLGAAPLVEDLQATAALINPYVLNDPRREITYDTAIYYQEYTRDWVETRCDDLGAGGF